MQPIYDHTLLASIYPVRAFNLFTSFISVYFFQITTALAVCEYEVRLLYHHIVYLRFWGHLSQVQIQTVRISLVHWIWRLVWVFC